MNELLKQIGSTAAAAFAAACCAGASWALAVLTALGAGFLIDDAVLIPLYVALLGLSVWLLSRSARAHRNLWPIYLAGAGALAALIGLWTSTVILFAGLGLIVASSFWDYLGARKPLARRSEPEITRWRMPSISLSLEPAPRPPSPPTAVRTRDGAWP